MRLGISVLSIFFSFQLLASDPAVVVSMSPDHIPCPGSYCLQKCTYDADAIIEYQGFEVDGKIKIQTLFDNQSMPGKIQLRTLVKVDIDMVGATAFWDETSVLDNQTLRLDRTYNYLKVGTGAGEKGLKKAEWSETLFTWPTSFVEVPTATVTAIGGKSADEIKRKSPKFYKYLKDTAFGIDWMSEFAGENPERRTDRDMKDFADNILSPTFVSLFHLRFIPFMQDFRYNLFVNYSATSPKKEYAGPFQVGMQGKGGPKANTVVFEGEIAFGDFESQPGKPAKFHVDKTTNQYERIELNMRNLKMGIAATAWSTSVKCE